MGLTVSWQQAAWSHLLVPAWREATTIAPGRWNFFLSTAEGSMRDAGDLRDAISSLYCARQSIHHHRSHQLWFRQLIIFLKHPPLPFPSSPSYSLCSLNYFSSKSPVSLFARNLTSSPFCCLHNTTLYPPRFALPSTRRI